MKTLAAPFVATAMLTLAASAYAQSASGRPSQNPAHPLWAIVGDVVRTVVDRTVPTTHGGAPAGASNTARPYPTAIPDSPFPSSSQIPPAPTACCAAQTSRVTRPAVAAPSGRPAIDKSGATVRPVGNNSIIGDPGLTVVNNARS